MNSVKIATSEDKMALQALWADAFHDEPDKIAHFLDKVFAVGSSIFALIVERGNALCGMLFLLPATLYFEDKQYQAGYIYAVATDEKYQNQGVMKELEKAACRLGSLQNMSILFLVPQEKSFFSIYEKSGYRTVSYKEEMRIVPKSTSNYSLDICSKEQFLYRRNLFLSAKTAYFELTKEAREYRFEQANENGEILFYSDDKDSGYLVTECEKNICKIKESDLSLEGIAKAAFAIAIRGNSHIEVKTYKMGKRTHFAMAKSLDNSLNPFDIEKANTYCGLMLE